MHGGDEHIGGQEVVEQIHNTPDDEESRRLEAEAMEQTDNGWQEGDPIIQPPQDVDEATVREG